MGSVWASSRRVFERTAEQKMSCVLPCQIHLKWWVDQIWDASSHKVRSSNLVSWRLPLSQCVHKSAQWEELFYHASSPRFKTQFEACQDQKSQRISSGLISPTLLKSHFCVSFLAHFSHSIHAGSCSSCSSKRQKKRLGISVNFHTSLASKPIGNWQSSVRNSSKNAS